MITFNSKPCHVVGLLPFACARFVISFGYMMRVGCIEV
jgi:hypothetical protein